RRHATGATTVRPRALRPRQLLAHDGGSASLPGPAPLGGARGTLPPVRANLASAFLAAHGVEEVREPRPGTRHQQCSGQAHWQTLATVNLCSPDPLTGANAEAGTKP